MTGGLEEVVVRAMLAGVAVFGVLAYLNHVLIVPMRARRNAYTVTRVQQETHNVWTIELTPPHGGQVPDYLPGQFHFLTLYREAGLRAEEHPFTISSSPTTRGRLTSTIKESGDFTSTIGRTKPGGGVAVQGPFGRFSTSLHPGQRDLVFIAGGIGITPLMSMLRYMRDTRPDTTVHLLCFNRTGEDIVFRDELAAIEAGDAPRLRVTHILSRPNDSWQGERGVATRDLLARLIDGDITTKAYYVCGPPPMMNVVIRALHDLGVPTPKVYYELFAL
jgi:predicted ferric reductase